MNFDHNSRKFSVDEKRVRERRKLRAELEKLPAKKRRLEGGGRKPKGRAVFLDRESEV